MTGGRERGEPVVRYAIDHDERAVTDARRVLHELLRLRGGPIADDVLLAANELVTNVVRHTEQGGELRVWDPGPDAPIRVEVEDADPTIPVVPTQPDSRQPMSSGGRGLAIVQAVDTGWGVDPLPAGKVVWAEFDRNRLAAAPTPPLSAG